MANPLPEASARAVNPEVILATNGPGELYTWVRPVLQELRRLIPGARVVVSLLPCPFASGHEARVALSMGADAVTSVAQYLAFAGGGPRPAEYRGSTGLVVGLGGDAMHVVRIARRLGRPAWRYSFEGYWNRGLERLFLPDERTAAKCSGPRDRVSVIGNITADALDAPSMARAERRVLVIPGSRRFEVVHMLPIFAAAVESIAREFPDASFHWPRSRLLTSEALVEALSARRARGLGGVATLLQGDTLTTPGGARIQVHDEDERYALMASATVAMTVPGTNTLELGLSGTPAVVCLPLDKPELIPLEGPAQYVTLIPWFGPWVKRQVAMRVLGRIEHVALPNMIARERIFPELRGHVTPAMISEQVVALLADRTERVRIVGRLLATMPKPGASTRLAEEIATRVATRPALRLVAGSP